MGGLSGTSGTGDRSQKYRSEVMSPGGSKKPSQPGWDRGGPADWKHIRNTSVRTTDVEAVLDSDSGSRDEVEMGVLAKEKYTI